GVQSNHTRCAAFSSLLLLSRREPMTNGSSSAPSPGEFARREDIELTVLRRNVSVEESRYRRSAGTTLSARGTRASRLTRTEVEPSLAAGDDCLWHIGGSTSTGNGCCAKGSDSANGGSLYMAPPARTPSPLTFVLSFF